MSLEEIKQEFRNNYHKLSVNIAYTFGWVNSFYSQKLKDFGLTPHQFNILRILKGHYPATVSINVLKNCMPDKMSDTSRLIERLRVNGFVERHVCPKDRRKADVVINEKGMELLNKIEKTEEDWDGFFNNITEKEASALNDLLDKLRG
jgi:DNA-binding MarR family transcriptional regulator